MYGLAPFCCTFYLSSIMKLVDFDISDDLKKIGENVINSNRISDRDAKILWDSAPLALLGHLASCVKQKKSGLEVYYNRNFHVEPTNVCLFNCRFCSYKRGADSPEAWNYSLEEIEQIVKDRSQSYITEVHIVGGVHPQHTIQHYCDMIKRVKAIMPWVAIKAFTAIELAYMIEKAGMSYEEGLLMLKEAGMVAIPGGGAEIFNEDIRAKICPDKGDSKKWLKIHEVAHKLGITTNATILYGHIESVEDRIDHLSRIRNLQDIYGGFNAFIPLKYRNFGNSMSEIGEVSVIEDMKMMALSRIYLDNVPHIKAYWPMLGKNTTELLLAFGADDIDGTIDDSTKIYSMAGAEDKTPTMSATELIELVEKAGYVAIERDTFYNRVNS